MNTLYKYIQIIVYLVLPSVIANAYEQTQLFTFDLSKVNIDNHERKGQMFTSVTYDGLINCNDIGEASLPYQIIEFEVPSDKYSFALTYKTKDSKELPHDYKIEINQKPVLSGQNNNEEWEEINEYTSRIYPINAAEIVQDGYLMGDRHLLHIFVSPFRYDADTDKLLFVESVEVTVRDLLNTQAKAVTNGTYTSLLRPLDMSRASLHKSRSSAINLPATIPLVGDNLPVYEYTVITSRELAPAFDGIIGFKKQKGMDAGVVCIEDILKDPAFVKGDTISGINDNAGKLRAFLTACRQSRSGEMFVLLGGNPNIVPVRYADQSIHEYRVNGKLLYHGDIKPTDWYYADLNGNWNLNDNDKYAEFDECSGIDFNPDIYVGRICCKNKKEVDNYTYKLIKYEMSPGNGDFSYLRRMISTEADDMQSMGQAKGGWDACKDIFDKHTVFRECPSYNSENTISPTGSEIIGEMKSTKYGFVNLHGHGGVWGMTVRCNPSKDIPHNILSLKNIPSRYSVWREEDNNSLDMLDNSDYPLIGYSMSCDLMPYDNMLLYVDSQYRCDGDSIIPSDMYNFGDSFTIGGHYGGPAFIGNTRVGYVSFSFDQEIVFLNKLKNDGCLGRVRSLTQSLFKSSKYYDKYVFHCKLTNNLLGCPEFKMWIKTPTTIDVSYQHRQTQNTRTFTCDRAVNVSGISVSDGSIVPYTTTLSDAIKTIRIPSENCITTLTGDYKIPHRMPLVLNNVTVVADGFYYVSSIGTSTASISSSVEFNKARVTFDSTGPIEINQNVTVDNGSDVTFISPELIRLKDLCIKNNSKVTIICNNGYTVEGTCECELGSKLIIKTTTN